VAGWRSRRVAGGFALALALALTPAPASADPPARDAPEQFGANSGPLFNSGVYTQAEIDSQLGALAATGATLVRSDALWERAEPQPPIALLRRYDWSFDDRIVRSLAAHELQWLPIIDYSANWDESSPGKGHSPPASVSDYAAYAGALAARYGPGGLFWVENPQLTPRPTDTYEIWNEPDNPTYWYPSPDPAAYADLYLRARRSIGAVDPGAHVIIGGLTRPAWFMQAVLAADPSLQTQIDGVAVHPYARTPVGVLEAVRGARLAMRADGLASVPLYVTEFGWTTHGRRTRDWAPAAARAGYIARTMSALGHTDCEIAAVLLYAWATPERNPAAADDWFGISPPGATGSADTAAFSAGLRSAAAPGSPSALCSRRAVLATRAARPRQRAHRHRLRRVHPKRRRRDSTRR
jgi:hypothetical protein